MAVYFKRRGKRVCSNARARWSYLLLLLRSRSCVFYAFTHRSLIVRFVKRCRGCMFAACSLTRRGRVKGFAGRCVLRLLARRAHARARAPVHRRPVVHFRNACVREHAHDVHDVNPFKARHARACSNLRLSPACGLYLMRVVNCRRPYLMGTRG